MYDVAATMNATHIAKCLRLVTYIHTRRAQTQYILIQAKHTRTFNADNNRSGNIWTETAPFAAPSHRIHKPTKTTATHTRECILAPGALAHTHSDAFRHWSGL